MSLLRLLQGTRASNPLQTLRSSSRSNPRATKMSNYFAPNPIGLPRSRFYSSSYEKYNRNVSNNTNLLYAMMGLNVVVFGYAAYTKFQARHGHPEKFIFFMRNMTCNLVDVVKGGMWWTTITSTFTHIDIWHLGANMFTAYFVGGFLCTLPAINPVRLAIVSLGAGVTGSVGYLYQRYLATGGNDLTHGLGFSGALMGMTTVAACLSPSTTFMIYGIVPMPLWGLALGYAFYDGYYLNDNQGRIGHAGHLGGSLFGVMFYILKLRGVKF